MLDFYCPKVKFRIEVDGLSHQSEKDIRDDKERDAWLQKQGILVQRYTSDQVFERIEEVVQDIINTCNKRVKE